MVTVEPTLVHDLPVLVVDDNATNRLILEEISDQVAHETQGRRGRPGCAGGDEAGGRRGATRTPWCSRMR